MTALAMMPKTPSSVNPSRMHAEPPRETLGYAEFSKLLLSLYALTSTNALDTVTHGRVITLRDRLEHTAWLSQADKAWLINQLKQHHIQ